jgi:hypothetical protein
LASSDTPQKWNNAAILDTSPADRPSLEMIVLCGPKIKKPENFVDEPHAAEKFTSDQAGRRKITSLGKVFNSMGILTNADRVKHPPLPRENGHSVVSPMILHAFFALYVSTPIRLSSRCTNRKNPGVAH